MQVIDLADEYKDLYFVCLEDWSDEIKEAGIHKQHWYEKMKEKGLRVKLALDDKGQVGGMIQYLPIEHSFVDGKGLYFIPCIWVHGHKKGRGDFRKRGMGKALLQAAERDAKERGARGLAAWGMSLPVFMRASWFRKQGYRKADKQGIQILLWKPFTDDAEPPQWIRQKKTPETMPGKVVVTACLNGWCPAMNMVFERAKRASAEFGEKVIFQAIDTFDRDTFCEWGISDGLFIDGKRMRTGPPLAYQKIKNKIRKAVMRTPSKST